jgi:hypothetical protein
MSRLAQCAAAETPSPRDVVERLNALGNDESLHDPLGCNVVQRILGVYEVVLATDQVGPTELLGVLGHHVHRPVQMPHVTAPAPAYLKVLLVEIKVRIEGSISDIRVLADHYVPAGIPSQTHAFGNSGRNAGGFDRDIGASASGEITNCTQPFFLCGAGDVNNDVNTEPFRCSEADFRAADHDYLAGATQLCKHSSRKSDRTGTLNDDSVTKADLGKSYRMQCSGHAAAGRQECAPLQFGRQRNYVDIRPQVDELRPPAEESVVGGQRDAIHLPRRTSGGRVPDCAVPAAPTVSVHIEERHDLPGRNRLTIDVEDGYSIGSNGDLVDPPDTDVTGDDRVWHTGQLALGEMSVSAAHFTPERHQQDSTLLKPRAIKRTHFNSLTWGRQDSGRYHLILIPSGSI